MRPAAVRFLSTVLFACAVFAQTPSTRVLKFVHTDSEQEFQEVATLIRHMTDIENVWSNASQKTVTVGGTADQIGLAEWLASELDTPANATPAKHEYKMLSGTDNVVRIFFLAQPLTMQSFQEVATLVRSISDTRRLFTYNGPRAIALRGTAEQAALAEWLIAQLDQPTPGAFETPEYNMLTGPENRVQVFFLKQPKSLQSLQELVTLVRSITDTRRMFTYFAPSAVAVRGTSEQLALTEWLFQQFEKAPQPGTSVTRAYPAASDGEDTVRVIYVKGANTPERLQEIALNARRQSGIRRLFTYNTPSAIAVRGTGDQTEQAERTIVSQSR